MAKAGFGFRLRRQPARGRLFGVRKQFKREQARCLLERRWQRRGSETPPYKRYATCVFTTTVPAMRSSTACRLGSHRTLRKPIMPIATPAT